MISFPDFELQDILTPTSPRHVSIILTLNNFTVHAIHCKRQMKPLFESMVKKKKIQFPLSLLILSFLDTKSR